MRHRIEYKIGYITKTLINFCFLSLFILPPSLCLGSIDNPARFVYQLQDPEPEVTVKVDAAKVMIADYDLIRKDFPSTKKMNEEQINEWLLKNFAYISKSQTPPNTVNTPIPTTPSLQRIGYRPKSYGRALVFTDLLNQGLVDIKGSGSKHPTQKSHQNGLLTTGEGLREFIYEKLVQKILNHYHQHHPSTKKRHTIGTYAVIDWNFDVIHFDGRQSAAGAVLRQGHDRFGNPNSDNYNFLPPEEMREIEHILRRYGVTSAGVGGIPHGFEIADLQGSKNCDVVDFGTFLVKPEFLADLTFLSDPLFEFEVKYPSQHFQQPHPQLSIPTEIWGHAGGPDLHPRSDIPRVYANQATIAFRRGEITRELLERQIQSLFFEPVEQKWGRDTSTPPEPLLIQFE